VVYITGPGEREELREKKMERQKKGEERPSQSETIPFAYAKLPGRYRIQAEFRAAGDERDVVARKGAAWSATRLTTPPVEIVITKD
jgi:hypothetical protein